MKCVKIILCVCLSGSLLVADDVSDCAMVVAQTQIPAEQITAQKAVFVGIEKFEPELVRTALMALAAQGQKVSALGVVEALEHARDQRDKAMLWPILAAFSYFLYGFGSSVLEFNYPGGDDRFISSHLCFSAISLGALIATMMRLKSVFGRISEIIDVLVHADAALDFSGGMQRFIQCTITLQQLVDGAKVTNLRLVLADMESHHAPSTYE